MTMTFIASASPSSGSVIFQNIPATFTHLQVRVFGRSQSSGLPSLYIGFNATEFGAPNYDSHTLHGTGASALSSAAINQGQINAMPGMMPSSGATANVFANVIIDILDYSSTAKNKVIRYLGGWDGNGSGFVMIGSGQWRQTTAINRVYVEPDGGFASGSRVDLYGIGIAEQTGA